MSSRFFLVLFKLNQNGSSISHQTINMHVDLEFILFKRDFLRKKANN